MATREQVLERRSKQLEHIRQTLDQAHAERAETIEGGEHMVAVVIENACIGCDQCLLVCDDDAIEMYQTPLVTSNLTIDNNRKARILRDPCTGCRLCVLACPTDAIKMIER